MVASRHGQLGLALALALLGICPPVQAEPNRLLLQLYGVYVPFGPGQGDPAVEKRMLFSPILGVYTLGNEVLYPELGPVERRYRESQLPQGDPFFKGTPIPDVSGAVIPFDQNRIQIKEGEREAAPADFRYGMNVDPWYSRPDEQMCAGLFREAWTYSTDVIAPEVEAVAVHLPNERIGTESFVVGAVKPDFPILVTSAFGQVLIQDGARALVSRSADELRVFNLTGIKNSVIVKFPAGNLLSIGPGSELIVVRAKDKLKLTREDGIARRGVSPLFSSGDLVAAVSEFAPASVLKATGLWRSTTSVGDSPEKRLSNRVLKSAAVLATMRGPHGFTGGGAMLAHKVGYVVPADNEKRTSVKEPRHGTGAFGLSPHVADADNRARGEEDIKVPQPSRLAGLRKYGDLLRAPLRVMRFGHGTDAAKTKPTVGSVKQTVR